MGSMKTTSAKRPRSHLAEAVDFIKGSLSREVRARRERAGLTQAELAHEADVRVETISRIERGRENPTLETLVKVVRAIERLGA